MVGKKALYVLWSPGLPGFPNTGPGNTGADRVPRSRFHDVLGLQPTPVDFTLGAEERKTGQALPLAMIPSSTLE